MSSYHDAYLGYDRRIRFLTSVIYAHLQQGPTTQRLHTGYDNLSTLLTTSSPEDLCFRRIKVFGRLDEDGFKVAIARQARDSKNPPQARVVVARPHDGPSCPEVMEQTLLNWDGRFSSHVSDVLSMIRAYQTPGNYDPQHLLRFVIRRCHRNIASRMHRCRVIWREHPIDVLRLWDPICHDEFEPTFHIVERSLAPFLEENCILPEQRVPEGDLYRLDRTTMKPWIKALVRLYDTVEDLLLENEYFVELSLSISKRRRKKSRLRVPKEALSEADVNSLATSMAILNALLRTKVVEAIFNVFSVFMAFVNHYNKQLKGVSTRFWDPKNIAKATAEEPFLGEVIPWPLYCLQSTCVHAAAASSILHHALVRKGVPIRASLVTFPALYPDPDISLTREDVRSRVLTSETPGEPCDPKSLDHLLNTVEDTQMIPGVAHPDGFMMCLVHQCFVSSDTSSIPPTQHVPQLTACELSSALQIAESSCSSSAGVSTSCCWCCWRLRDCLALNPPQKFLLPKNHGVIVPWGPPLGIPLSVLETLEHDLVAKLHQLAY
ncbi:hypothetical protein BV25DRAFT_494037 [Artomyces pyxidatus]|uniref:Uncharacterized protein n=1 Tax=Artomyces pyxidatus TaxID=48021 RepID=A0ACB8T2N4_9AGAM|nr:hypothetical protein BV25DRAFT_494037 [Artomyces pyxidatus]